MGRLAGPKRHFPKVREAREALAERAKEILEQYLKVVTAASAAGDYEVATKSLQWLMEHMPSEEGDAMIDVSIDKVKQVEGGGGPSINIGFALGGIPASQHGLALPAVIEVTPDDNDEDDSSND